MSSNTKLMIGGLIICIILGLLLQNSIAESVIKSSAGDELLTPDQIAKQSKKDAIKTQKSLKPPTRLLSPDPA